MKPLLETSNSVHTDGETALLKKLPRRKQRGISGNYLTGYAASGGVLDPNENKPKSGLYHNLGHCRVLRSIV